MRSWDEAALIASMSRDGAISSKQVPPGLSELKLVDNGSTSPCGRQLKVDGLVYWPCGRTNNSLVRLIGCTQDFKRVWVFVSVLSYLP